MPGELFDSARRLRQQAALWHQQERCVLIFLSLTFLREVIERLAKYTELFFWNLEIQEWVTTGIAPQTTR